MSRNRSRQLLPQLVCLVLAAAAALLTGCAPILRKPPKMDPFARAVLLIYDARKGDSRVSDALLWLDLETGKPRSVRLRAFDERDRPLDVNPKQVTWSGTENLKIEPGAGSITVKVTLLGGGAGRLRATIGNHQGEIRVRKQGD